MSIDNKECLSPKDLIVIDFNFYIDYSLQLALKLYMYVSHPLNKYYKYILNGLIIL